MPALELRNNAVRVRNGAANVRANSAQGGDLTPGFAPLVRFRASSLSSQANNSDVTAWGNQGRSGATHNAGAMGAGAAPKYLAAGSGQPARVRFVAGILATATNLPAGFRGKESRTFGVQFILGGGSCNLIGTGVSDSNGHICDLAYTTGSTNKLIVHLFGPQVDGPAQATGVLTTRILRITKTGSSNTVEILDETLTVLTLATGVSDFDTSAAVFYLGGSSYTALNTSNARELVWAFGDDTAMPNSQMATELTLLNS